MDAEQIVRALAKVDAPIDADYGSCGLCGAYERVRVESETRGLWVDDPNRHDPVCPWRLAKEWQDHIWIEVTDLSSLPDRVWMCNRHPGELRRELQ